MAPDASDAEDRAMRARRSARLAAAGVIGLLGTLGCGEGASTPVALSSAVSACPSHDLEGEVTCHRITVPEDPSEPDGRTIDLEVMVLQSRAEAGAESGDASRGSALVVIPGGPGQSATRAEGPRSYFAEVFDPLRDERDIVLIAPRGTAGSNELLLEPDSDRVFDDLATVVPASWAREGLARLEERADLTMYTTSRIADDLEATRAALGYELLDIYGTSYGTRVAQLYAIRYPDRVRTLILKAPVPPSALVPLTYTANAQRALDAIFELCREQATCRETYPDIEERFDDLMQRLERDPVVLVVTNPLSGDEVEIEVDHAAFGYVLRNMMMPAAGGAVVLRLIDDGSRGDFSLLAQLLPQLRGGYVTGLAHGMALSIIGSEDVPLVTEEMLEEDARAGFLRGAVARGMMAATADWPRADVPDDVHAFLEGDTPTLIVAGAFDPATPPSYGEEIARRLSNARLVVFPGGAHSANNFLGLDGLMAEFVRTASVDGLDLSAADENRPLPLVPDGGLPFE